MILNGIRAIAIYNPADGVAVQISKPVANTFDFTKQPLDLGERSAMGALLDQADSSACRFQFLDSDGTAVNQLEAWRAARTRVSLVAVGHSVCIQWYETDHFTITRAPLSGMAQGRADKYTFEMTRDGHGKHAIYQQANLLAHINGNGVSSWQEQGTSGVAQGYTSTGAGTLDWNDLSNAQSVTHNTADEGIYVDIVFPLRLIGYTLSLSSSVVEGHTDTGTATVRIEGRNFAGSTINSAETDSAIGRATAAMSTNIDALYTIRVKPILTPTGVTTSDDVIGGDPVLRVDGKTTFIDN